MCGMAGIFAGKAMGEQALAAGLRAMADALRHRGPDAEGFWSHAEAGIGFAHRRLSIIDLSPAGAQPMHSHCGRFALVHNGEIYNFGEMRAGLEARHGTIAWRGHSDTEVLVESFAREGIEATLEGIDGMFAAALFDRERRELHLLRDAFGEKPLYYGLWHGQLLFGSELRALEAVEGFAPELDPQALGAFFKYSYAPGPATIWRGAYKLPPAHRLTIAAADIARGELPAPQCWWDMAGTALDARTSPFAGSMDEAVTEAGRLLLASATRRMVADVPLGAFLSGGIDSSLTVAMMQAASPTPVRSFSIGMAEDGYDESPAARAVAAHLGTDHTELVLSPAEVQEAIPVIGAVHDEPFADASQVPTWLVARMARREVAVALSGDGGDEVFGGYNRYFHGASLWRRASRLPPALRRGAGAALAAIPGAMINRAVALAGPLAPGELGAGRAAEKIQKLARVMAMPDEAAFHDRLLATCDNATQVLLAATGRASLPERLADRGDPRARGLPFAERAMLLDTGNYMPDDVLVKVDRAAMAHSLETRTPYLERALFRFAWSLPPALRYGSGEGKSVLRELLYRHVPRALVDRPKAGFGIPVGRWMRTGLRDWAESELSQASLARSGLLDVAAIRASWAEHLAGRRDNETMLWNILMFQAWWRGRHG